MFKTGQRVYLLPCNPVDVVQGIPVRSSGDFAALTPDDVAALSRSASSQQDSVIYVVAAFTGLRMGELRALEWRDVDFGKRLVHVRHNYVDGVLGDPKSGKVRCVPMTDPVVGALDRLSQRGDFTSDADFVFCNQVAQHIDNSALRRRFAKALADAGLKRVRFHDLRHTFGTLAVQAFPLSDVKAFMGHADISTTMIYVHHVPQHDAANRLSRVIAGEGGLFPGFLARTASSQLRPTPQGHDEQARPS